MSESGDENIQIKEGIITANINAIKDDASKFKLKQASTGDSRSDALNELVETYEDLSTVIDSYVLKLQKDLETIHNAISTIVETDDKLSDSVQTK